MVRVPDLKNDASLLGQTGLTIHRSPAPDRFGPPGVLLPAGETIHIGGPPRKAAELFDAIDEEDRSRRALRKRIADLVAKLQSMSDDLGTTPFIDTVIALQVERMANASAVDETLARRDLLVRLVRDASQELAAARRDHVADVTAQTLADLMIARSSAAPIEIIPFGKRLEGARAELVSAIKAGGRRGRPMAGEKIGAGASENATLVLLRKVGLSAGSASTIRNAKARMKKVSRHKATT